jgi:hypothetical protein
LKNIKGGGSMKIKEQTIKELEAMKPSDIYLVYELIRSIKASKEQKTIVGSPGAYQKSRLLLKNCKGSLSSDIIRNREDRV